MAAKVPLDEVWLEWQSSPEWTDAYLCRKGSHPFTIPVIHRRYSNTTFWHLSYREHHDSLWEKLLFIYT